MVLYIRDPKEILTTQARQAVFGNIGREAFEHTLARRGANSFGGRVEGCLALDGVPGIVARLPLEGLVQHLESPGPPCEGCGMAIAGREVAALALAEGFLGLALVWCLVSNDLIPSFPVLKKVGFTHRGAQERRYIFIIGKRTTSMQASGLTLRPPGPLVFPAPWGGIKFYLLVDFSDVRQTGFVKNTSSQCSHLEP